MKFKKIAAFILLIAMCLGVVACTSNAPESTTETNAPQETETSETSDTDSGDNVEESSKGEGEETQDVQSGDVTTDKAPSDSDTETQEKATEEVKPGTKETDEVESEEIETAKEIHNEADSVETFAFLSKLPFGNFLTNISKNGKFGWRDVSKNKRLFCLQNCW